jgi:outer membrane protein assembly factor BamB
LALNDTVLLAVQETNKDSLFLRQISPTTGEILEEIPSTFAIATLLPRNKRFIGKRLSDDARAVRKSDLALVELNGGAFVKWKISTTGKFRPPGAPRLEPNRFSYDVAYCDGRVFVGRGDTLLALDAESGIELWASSLRDFGGPVGPDGWDPMVGEDKVLINVGTGVVAFDTASGQPCWRFAHKGGRSVYDGLVFIITREGLYSVLTLTDGRELQHCDVAATIANKWKSYRPTFLSTPAVTDSHAFLPEEGGYLFALDRQTGIPVWRHRPRDATGYLGALPVVIDGRLYVSTVGWDKRHPSRLYCYEHS